MSTIEFAVRSKFTHQDTNYKFEVFVNNDEQVVEFLYIDYIQIKQYSCGYVFDNIIFRDILPHFIRDTFEDLMDSYAYKIKEVSDKLAIITFNYKLLKKDLSFTIEIERDEPDDSKSSEIDILKSQVAALICEIKIMKDVIMRDSNKIRITESYISDAVLPKSEEGQSSIVYIPDQFIQMINNYVISRFGKILKVRINKIQHLMRIDVDLELYSKECYYMLSHQAVNVFESKNVDTIDVSITRPTQSIFLGADIVKPPWSISDEKSLVGIYVVLVDRRSHAKNCQNKSIQIYNVYDDDDENKKCISPEFSVYFPENGFPLNDEASAVESYARYLNQDKKQIENMNLQEREKYMIDREILEKLAAL